MTDETFHPWASGEDNTGDDTGTKAGLGDEKTSTSDTKKAGQEKGSKPSLGA